MTDDEKFKESIERAKLRAEREGRPLAEVHAEDLENELRNKWSDTGITAEVAEERRRIVRECNLQLSEWREVGSISRETLVRLAIACKARGPLILSAHSISMYLVWGETDWTALCDFYHIPYKDLLSENDLSSAGLSRIVEQLKGKIAVAGHLVGEGNREFEVIKISENRASRFPSIIRADSIKDYSRLIVAPFSSFEEALSRYNANCH